MSGFKLGLVSLGLVIGAAVLSAALGTFLPQLGMLRVIPVAVAVAVICSMAYQHLKR